MFGRSGVRDPGKVIKGAAKPIAPRNECASMTRSESL